MKQVLDDMESRVHSAPAALALLPSFSLSNSLHILSLCGNKLIILAPLSEFERLPFGKKKSIGHSIVKLLVCTSNK